MISKCKDSREGGSCWNNERNGVAGFPLQVKKGNRDFRSSDVQIEPWPPAVRNNKADE